MRTLHVPLTIVDRDDVARATYPRPAEIAALVDAMPQFAGSVDYFEQEWSEAPDGPGLYLYVEVIFDWLNPLLADGRDIDSRFFDWMEALATSPNLATRHFLSAGLLEVMGDDARGLARLRAQMGPATVELSVETEASWGRSEPGQL